jgi:hypothetical protein
MPHHITTQKIVLVKKCLFMGSKINVFVDVGKICIVSKMLKLFKIESSRTLVIIKLHFAKFLKIIPCVITLIFILIII